MSAPVRIASPTREVEQIRDCVQRYLDGLNIEKPSGEALRDWIISGRVANGLESDLGQSLIFVAGDPIRGLAVVRCADSIFAPNGYCFVDVLWVEPGHRGSGVARSLMSEVEAFARARGCRSVELHANAQNQRAVSLYESMGFSAWTDSYDGFQRYYRRYL